MKIHTKLFSVIACLFLLLACNDEDKKGNFSSQGPVFFEEEWPASLDALGLEGEILPDKTMRKNYMLVVDFSGSMGGNEDVARRAIESWLTTVPDDSNLGLIIFGNNYGTKMHVNLGRSNKDDIVNALKKETPGGGTPLTDAITLAHTELQKQAHRQGGPYGQYNIVVITDGAADSSFALESKIDSIVNNRLNPVRIQTIGFGIGERHTLNQPGRTIYMSADNEDELTQSLASVTAETTIDVGDGPSSQQVEW